MKSRIVGDSETNRCPHGEATGHYCIDCELLLGCKWFMDQLHNGILIRNTITDDAPQWAIRMGEFVIGLKRVNDAIERAEKCYQVNSPKV